MDKAEFIENYSYLDSFAFCIDRNEAVENAIFKAAIDGNTPSMIAWLKNKSGWDDGKAAAAVQEVIRHVPIDKIQIEILPNKKNRLDDVENIDSNSDRAPE